MQWLFHSSFHWNNEAAGPQPAKIFGEGRSHFWERLWRHWCAVNHDSTFLLWSAYQLKESRGGARGVPGGGALPPKNFVWPPQNFSGLFLKVLHRPLTAPLVAKLAPPVDPQMTMSGSAPEREHMMINSEKRKLVHDYYQSHILFHQKLF